MLTFFQASEWRNTAAPIFWNQPLPNAHDPKAKMLDDYGKCKAEVFAQLRLVADWFEVIRESNGLCQRLIPRPTRRPDLRNIDLSGRTNEETADQLKRTIGSTLKDFYADVLSPIEAAVVACELPRVECRGGDSCRI